MNRHTNVPGQYAILACAATIFLMSDMCATSAQENPSQETAVQKGTNTQRKRDQKGKWDQKDWKAFVEERTPNASVPRPGELICIGSSHMARWESVSRDLAPLTVYNFGIGGTTMQDAAQAFARNLVIPFSPRAVILYEGSNDIARNTTPEQILGHFQVFYQQIREALPRSRLYVLGIVPSPGKRFEKWETIKAANAILQDECEQHAWLSFIDTTSGLIDQDGQPRMECFIPNNIHMNPRGYQVWAAAAGPVILEAERQHQSR